MPGPSAATRANRGPGRLSMPGRSSTAQTTGSSRWLQCADPRPLACSWQGNACVWVKDDRRQPTAACSCRDARLAVEFVEAFTIVLAMGLTRGWRSTLAGTAVALVALAVVVIVAGYALAEYFPEALLQLVIGTLLLIFGLQWLRKAVMRSAGLKLLHDEQATFGSQEAALASAARDGQSTRLVRVRRVVQGGVPGGLEVVFIVLTFGVSAQCRWPRRGGWRTGDHPRRRRPHAAAALTGAGEHDQVRRRDPAVDVRDVLGDRGLGVFSQMGRASSGRRRPRPARRAVRWILVLRGLVVSLRRVRRVVTPEARRRPMRFLVGFAVLYSSSSTVDRRRRHAGLADGRSAPDDRHRCGVDRSRPSRLP